MSFDVNAQLKRKPALIVRNGRGIKSVEFLRFFHPAHCYGVGRESAKRREIGA